MVPQRITAASMLAVMLLGLACARLPALSIQQCMG